MEPLAAVFRVRDTLSSKRKFAHVWIKNAKEAVEKCRKKVPATEALEAVWTIDWRNPEAQYNLVFGNRWSAVDKVPAIDLAASLRTMFLRKPSDHVTPPWARNRRRDNVVQLVRDLITTAAPPASDTPKYKSPFVVSYAKAKEAV